MVVLNTEEESDVTQKIKQNRCVAEFLQIAGMVAYWLYGGMDPRSFHESYPPGSLDRCGRLSVGQEHLVEN